MTTLLRLSALLALLVPGSALAQAATLFDGRQVAGIVHEDASSARLAGELLARDMAQLTGRTPRVSASLDTCQRLCVVIGRRDSPLVRAAAADAGVDLSALSGQWERYVRVLARSRSNSSTRQRD